MVLLFFVSQSEPSIFIKYQAKPQLLGGDTKDESLFSLPLPVGKSKGLSKQFEKTRAFQRKQNVLLIIRSFNFSIIACIYQGCAEQKETESIVYTLFTYTWGWSMIDNLIYFGS